MVPDRKFAAAVAAAWGFVMLGAPVAAGADPAVDIPVPPAQPAIDSPGTAAAEPSADPAVALAGSAAAPAGPPLDTGLVMSGPPGVAQLLDGRTLTVVAKDETQLPVAPLTTALSSRDWLVGATFTGSTTGSTSGGTLEVGYQIGCGVEMDKVRLLGLIGGNLGNIGFDTGGISLFETVAAPMTGQIRVEPRPGTVSTVPVYKKTFKGTSARVTVKDIHIKVDNCVGASSLRSYAVFTSAADGNADIVSYYGVTKVF
jgi:hypothetical protein